MTNRIDDHLPLMPAAVPRWSRSCRGEKIRYREDIVGGLEILNP